MITITHLEKIDQFRLIIFTLTLFLISHARTKAQNQDLASYIQDYAISTDIYINKSNRLQELFKNANDSCQYYLKCDIPLVFIATMNMTADKRIIDFDALNVWSDQTYIDKIKVAERFLILQIEDWTILCSRSVIDHLSELLCLSISSNIKPIGPIKSCKPLIGTGLYFGIEVHKDNLSMSYFNLLRSRG